MPIAHRCNPYCRDGLHAHLLYTSADATEKSLKRALRFHQGLTIESAKPEPDAKPEEGGNPLVGGRQKPMAMAWWIYFLGSKNESFEPH